MSIGLLTRRGSEPSAAAMDPRVAERRHEVARLRSRRRRRRLLQVLGAVTAVVAVLALLRSSVFDVDQITVRGAERSGTDAVLEASGVQRGDALIDVDADAVADRLVTLPWVEKAKVRRSWPGAVVLEVTERVAVAQITGEGGRLLVDDEGNVLGDPAAGDALPLIEGDFEVGVGGRLDEAARAQVRVVAAIPEALIAELRAVSIDADGGLFLTLNDSITVEWGDANRARAKADRLLVLLEQADRSTIKTIDVTVPDAAAITRVPQSDPPGGA